jgi:hypothetical protein
MDLNHVRKIFDAMDRSHHGEVNVRDLIVTLRRDTKISEFLHVSQDIRQEGSARTLQKIFNEVDADHNHTISWSEFESYFSSHTFDEDTKTFVPKQTETEDRYQTQGEYGKQGSATSELQDDPNRNKELSDQKPNLSTNKLTSYSDKPQSSSTLQLQDGAHGIEDLRRELAQLHMEFASLQAVSKVQTPQNTTSLEQHQQKVEQRNVYSFPSSHAPSGIKKTSATSSPKPYLPLHESSTSVAVSHYDVSDVRKDQNISKSEDLAHTKLYSRIQILEEHARIASEERSAANTMLKELAGRVESAIRLVTDSMKNTANQQNMYQKVTKIENRLSILEQSVIKEQENTLRSLELLIKFKPSHA